MSMHVVLWSHLAILVIWAGPDSPGPKPRMEGKQEETGSNLSVGVTGDQGRYSIDRVILDGSGPPHHPSTGPAIETHSSPNITAVTGQVAQLNCRVHNLGNRTVSWIRLSDLSLLTVGRYTYTSDLRFEGIHAKHSPDWRLALKSPRVADTGLYECQVSTTPHMSHLVHLRVRDPVTRMLGGTEMFVEMASMINLTCLIAWTARPPDSVLWFHNGSEVTYNGPRPGVSLIVDKSEVTTVSLLLQLASPEDSGSYTCRPDNAPPAHISIHVLAGDGPAELSGCGGVAPSPLLLLPLAALGLR